MTATACPMCKQPVAAPSLEDAIAACPLNGFEEKILSAVWAGRGMPVQTEPIFSRMFEDDPDGGPSPTRMYAAFYQALGRLNSQLSDTGIAVVSNRYRKGYRLSLGANRGQGF